MQYIVLERGYHIMQYVVLERGYHIMQYIVLLSYFANGEVIKSCVVS